MRYSYSYVYAYVAGYSTALGILSHVTIIHQPVTVSLNTCAQMHVQIRHSLAHLQDLIPTLAGIKHISDNTSQSSD